MLGLVWIYIPTRNVLSFAMLDIIFLMLDIAAWCAPRSFCTIHKEQTNIGVLQTTCHGLFLALCLTSPRIGVLKSLSSSSFCLLESDSLGVANSGNGSLECHVEVQVQSLAELFVSQTNHYPVSDEYPSQFPKVASVGQLMKIRYELLSYFFHMLNFALSIMFRQRIKQFSSLLSTVS